MTRRTARRERFMNWWWDAIGPGHLRIQLGVARIACLYAGHEHWRYQWCDWCGKDMTRHP